MSERNKCGTRTGFTPEAILDSISDGVIAMDVEKHVVWLNHAAEKITGVSCREAIGRRCSDVLQSSICGGPCAFQRKRPTCPGSVLAAAAAFFGWPALAGSKGGKRWHDDGCVACQR